MSNNSYDEILQRARHELNVEEQLKLINELCQRPPEKSRPHSIRELKGLGKHIWEGIDPDAYIREERGTWSG